MRVKTLITRISLAAVLLGCVLVDEHEKHNKIDTVVVVHVDSQPKSGKSKKKEVAGWWLLGKIGASFLVVSAIGKLIGLW